VSFSPPIIFFPSRLHLVLSNTHVPQVSRGNPIINMTGPAADHRPSTAEATATVDRRSSLDSYQQQQQQHDLPRPPPTFAPIFTLVNNTSTRSTHHPHVRYIFSDDDPDILTQALSECEEGYHNNAYNDNPNDNEEGGEGAGDPRYYDNSPARNNNSNRAMILELAPNDDGSGGYSVAWSSSLSPSWAVLDAQLSRISPPSSDAGHGYSNRDKDRDRDGSRDRDDEDEDEGADDRGGNTMRSGRLMLRIEGIETSSSRVPSTSELKIPSSSPPEASNRQYHQRSGSLSGSGTGQQQPQQRGTDDVGAGGGGGDDYASILDEFDKRMTTLRKVVNASEDRRKRIAALEEQEQAQQGHEQVQEEEVIAAGQEENVPVSRPDIGTADTDPSPA